MFGGRINNVECGAMRGSQKRFKIRHDESSECVWCLDGAIVWRVLTFGACKGASILSAK